MARAATNKTARQRAIVKKPARDQHDEDSSSSDEDEEGIPAHPSPPKVQGSPYGPTLRPASATANTKRYHEEPMRAQSNASKRQKTTKLAEIPQGLSSGSPSRLKPGYLALTPRRIAQQTAGIASQGGSGHLSNDEDVPADMLDIVNNVYAPRAAFDSPSLQLHTELSHVPGDDEPEISDLDIDDHDGVDVDQESQEPELEDKDLSVKPLSPRDKASSAGEAPESIEPRDVEQGQQDSPVSRNGEDVRGARDAIVKHGRDGHRIPSPAPNYDVYEVPYSPQAKASGRTSRAPINSIRDQVRIQTYGGRKLRQRRQARQLESRALKHALEQHDKGDPQLEKGDEELEVPESIQGPQVNVVSPAVSQRTNADPESDFEYSDFNLEDDLETALTKDVQTDIVVGGHPITIFIPKKQYMRMSALMRRPGWTGIRGDWITKLTETHAPRTNIGDYLATYLTKLERLIFLTPQVSQVEPSSFLNEYRKLLENSFSKVERGVEHIRLKIFSSKCDNARREAVAWDLVRLIVPTFVRVLGEAWALGGNESSFTKFTVQLLTRLVGLTAKLYGALSCESGLQLFEEEPDSSYSKVEWRKGTIMRNKLGPYLDALLDKLKHAPSSLEKKELQLAQEKRRRQWKLERQKTIKRELELDVKTRQEAQREQNLRVVRAIRGAAAKREAQGTRDRGVAHVSQAAAPRGISQSTRKTRSSLTWDLWREEEVECLCTKLQQAFEYELPQLPDLATTATIIGHSSQETKDKARDLLSLILSTAYPDRSGREIQSDIQQLMRQWA